MKQLTIIFSLLLAFSANATYGPDPDVDISNHQGQEQGQDQNQEQTQSQHQSASASNDGVKVGGDSVENNTSQIVLVPNNNTENCLRVFGFGFGKDGSSGGFGVPWRSKACDFEQAADDAFAAGERELGWYWKCHNKSLYRTFKGKGESSDLAIEQCHSRMIGDRIKRLEDNLAFIQAERYIEREKCEESKDRMSKAWKESCVK
jgi:hypothetical protein